MTIRAASLLLMGGLLLLSGLAILLDRPPAALPETAPPDVFSAGRAFRHIQAFAEVPHPLGSTENYKVRHYILDRIRQNGLEPFVQESIAVLDTSKPTVATVRNVVVSRSGTANTAAVLLMAHYDSVPSAGGAADDGSGVATLLETMRAVSRERPFRNDLIFLFTNGEEAGLLGARAFVKEQAAAANIGVVLNFEARGNGGPAYMFETSAGNRWLIDQFASAVPFPAASSLSYEIYKRLPNDTDFTRFSKAGFKGLNFAFIDGLTHYHTRLDSPGEIQQASLQHQGSYALSLARHFGNLEFPETVPTGGDAIYGNLIGTFFFHYSDIWALPSIAFSGLLLIVLIAAGLWRGVLQGRRIWVGIGAFVIVLIATALGVFLLGRVLSARGIFEGTVYNQPYNADWYLLALVAFGVLLTGLIYVPLMRRVPPPNLSAGALTLWFVLLASGVWFVPGSHFVLFWPLLASAGAFFWQLVAPRATDRVSVVALLWLLLCAFPPVMLTVLARQFYVAMTLAMAPAVALLVVLMIGLWLPQLSLIYRSRAWLLPGLAGIAAFGFFCTALATAGFDDRHPRADSLFYLLDTDQDKALWGTTDGSVDEWTRTALGANPRSNTLEALLPVARLNAVSAPAPALDLLPPRIEVLSHQQDGDLQKLQLRIQSARKAPNLFFFFCDPGIRIIEAFLNGKTELASPDSNRQSPDPWGFLYMALPEEGIVLDLKIRSAPGSFDIKLVDQSYGLPYSPRTSLRPRPQHLMSDPYPRWLQDSVLVSATVAIPATASE